MNPRTYQRRNTTSTAMRIFVVISIAFISIPATNNIGSNSHSDNENGNGSRNGSRNRTNYGFVSSFQLNTINTINTVQVRTGGVNIGLKRNINVNSYNYGRRKQSQHLSLTLPQQQQQQQQSGRVNYTRRSSNNGLTTSSRLYTSNGDENETVSMSTSTSISINDNNDDQSQSKEAELQSQSPAAAAETGAGTKTGTRTGAEKEKEWNTSIFPSPVEQGKFIPQIYIQTIAAFIGIASGVSVSLFKLSIDAIRQFCYEGVVNVNVFAPLFPFQLPLSLPISISSSVPIPHVPVFLIPIFGSVAVTLLSLTGKFSPGLRGAVKEVDDDSLLSGSAYSSSTTTAGITSTSSTITGTAGTGAGTISRKRDLFLNPFRKSLAAVVTLGTGNSLGPEGPGVEIGAAVSRFGMLLWPPDLIQNFNDMKNNMKEEKLYNNGSSGSTFNENGYGYGGYYGENSNGEGKKSSIEGDENNNDVHSNDFNGVSISDNRNRNRNNAEEDAERIARNRLLLACGAAAGVSSGFNAPLSGVFFALEVVQASLQPINLPSPLKKGSASSSDSDGDNNGDGSTAVQQQSLSSNQGSVTAILISSVLAALVARGILGNELALMLVTYDIVTPLIELPLYILLGMSCGVVSVIFSQTAKLFKNVFEGNIGPKPVRDAFNALPAKYLPIIGGITCGIVGIFYPQILFFGYDTLNKLLEDNTLPTSLLLTLLAAKTFTTAICASSGLVGGTLAPSLFLGGMVGASFHNIACDSLATLHLSDTIASSSDVIFDLAGVPAYSMVGAASVLAAIFRAPLTASLLMFEITRNYEVLLPLLASAGVASLVSDILERKVEEAKS